MKLTHPVARKKHECELCGKPIKIGEQYTSIKTEYGDWYYPEELDNPYQTIHRHIECNNAWKLISDAYGDDERFCFFYDKGTIDAMYDSLADGEVKPSDFKGNETIIQRFLDQTGFTEIIKKNEEILKKNQEEWNRRVRESRQEESI